MIEVITIISRDIIVTLGSIAAGFLFLTLLAYTYVSMLR